MTIARTRRRGASTIAAAAALLVSLTGCGILPGTGDDIPDDLRLSPSGDAGAWMHDGYAAGIAGEWARGDMICGITPDGIAIHADTSEVTTRLTATDVRTDEDLWELATETEGGTTCGRVLGDRMYVFETEQGADGIDRSQIARVDLATGERTTIYRADIKIMLFDAFAHRGETAYVVASADVGSVLLALDGEREITWQAPMSATTQCHLIDAHIACADITGPYTVLDADTGEVRTEGTVEEANGDPVAWASDGFALTTDRVSFTEATYTGYAFDGTETGALDNGRASFMPGPFQGVLYPLADFDAWTVQSVDAAGTPVTRLPTGFGSEDEIIATGATVPGTLEALSADGRTFVYSEYGTNTKLIDAEGTEIAALGDTFQLQVMGGFLVVDQSMSPRVLLPAG